MNTKAIIGIIIVVVIIGVGIWLHKAPASPDEPIVAKPLLTAEQPATQPTSIGATGTAPSSGTAGGQTTATPSTTKNIISTKTIDGMKIDVTKEGTGAAIVNGQTAQMLYTGKLADGSIFDSTDKHGGQPFEFSLGAGQVIKGWDEGVLGMKVGEQRTLTIPAALAYGANGFPPVIPPNATLTFTVTLVGIK